ncbi:MAG: hypothetical protein KGQ41_00150 [Alphaproteobacteria bacterium]|nr:hypothetical protein [Alphaproteobacteria bacterium]
MKLIASSPLPTPSNTEVMTAHKNRFSVSRTAGSMPVYTPSVTPSSFATPEASTSLASASSDTTSFKDVLDVINPLQHIPVVSTFYRKASGDEISPVARVIGGAIFGGPIGGALALADTAIKMETGSTVGEKILNLVSSDKENTSTADISPDTVMHVALRKSGAPRMAGSIPVWGGNTAPETRFAAMVHGLTSENNHIS